MILPLALVQMTSTTSIEENLTLAEPLIREAAKQGAKLISLPEVSNLVQIKRTESTKEACFQEEDRFLSGCQSLAKELGVWIHIGSCVIKLPDDNRMANRAFMIDDQGEIKATYDKIHMFDVDLEGGESYRESTSFKPGEHAVTVETPWGTIGLTICYDVRFPHLHRSLAHAGAKVILNPAAFTQKTGEAHWHILLAARAIETTCFVAAAAQTGHHDDGRDTYGHSLVIDPWGKMLADAGTTIGIIRVDLDLEDVTKARAMVPSLQNGRDFSLPNN
ncbi:carbon-nitrogen hydrolase family protein [Curvivirga aplysinae]|uniref:carbon-nitrogen hydrolase family protein n=1 Tax=Curvivirga aplysinae TaxID=2529852 RepID=UPI0012BD65EE|nr:carbon-nitrogen hydrolase family protein [Curvivirga aplysinae]MTI08659.1 carbon-nitrogen hydrolase family protein [Curvivirga aplysinae]